MKDPRQLRSLQDLVAAERDAAPDADADARVWAGIEHRLVHGPPPPGLPEPGSGLALGTIKLIGGLVLTLAGIAGVGLLVRGDEPPPAVAAPALPEVSARVDPPQPLPTPQLLTTPAPVAVRVAPAAPPSGPKLKPRTVRTDPPVVDAPLDLEGELRLVASIRAALRRGDTDAALAAIAEHKRKFAAGALVQERSAHEVEALCVAGRTADARALADEFMRRWPESTHRARVAAACSG